MGDDSITPDFSRSEFSCPCCGTDNISLAFVSKLQRVRDIYKKPMPIASGCRCVAHNMEVGGVVGSVHIAIPNGSDSKDGRAADIVCLNGLDRAELLAACFEVWPHPHRRIGIGGTFIHVDDDLAAPSPRVWLYLPSKRHVA